MKRRLVAMICGATAVVLGVVFTANPVWREVKARMASHTVESRVAELGMRVESVWVERCRGAGVVFPPPTLVVVVLKLEREVRVLGPRADGAGHALLATYPILAASGAMGPKLREGDRQVPEGVYGVEALNPNSRYHLALRVSYPSEEDRRAAAAEGRTKLGGDIMIHGGSASIGCVAIGDAAIEEVFVLAARVGIGRVELVMCPSAEPTKHITPTTAAWVAERYRVLDARLRALGAQ